jgi:Holliday junction resolvase RusA-like endonuclease
VRHKTPQYRRYLRDLQLLLPPMSVPAGKLRLKAVFGISNPRADVDNLLKGFIDGLMAKYHFDDSRIFSLMAHKIVVPRQREFIEFAITAADTPITEST